MNNRQAQATSPHAGEDDEAHRGTLRHRVGGAWTVLPVTFVARRSGHDADNSDRLRTDEPRRAREPAQRTMIAMPATPAGLYITGHIVMALRHPSIGMGFNWRVSLRTAPGMLAHRSDNPALSRGTAATAKAIGKAEIVDLRAALRSVHHPDAERTEPIWSATHVRAVLELVWQKLEPITQGRSRTKLRDTYDRRTMRVWLDRTERVRAARLGGAMMQASEGIEITQWNEWLQDLTR